MDLSPTDRRLLAALEGGLPLVGHPYAVIGERVGLSEAEVIERLQTLLETGVIKRLGLVVRHHEIGYRANAMTVFDVPDERVDAVGRALAASPDVTLCYRRPRRPPAWPYNLFAMVHGREREAVLGRIAALRAEHGLEDVPFTVLFSTKRFKQRGARYFATAEVGG
jgi:DNA-binding Lrp family transcriptional regulator